MIFEQSLNLLYSTIQEIQLTLKPPPKFTISQWADAERFLSPEFSAEPGRWDTNRAPYQRGMMDAVTEPGTEKIIFMTSSQVGKTSILENIIAYFIAYDPAPMLVVMPTLQLAQAFSKDRLSPMFRDTPCLKGKAQHERTKDGTNTILHKTFPGGQLTLSGANSPASLASRPIRILLCDEISRWPQSAGTEGNPLHLAQKRTTAFFNRKMIYASTPGLVGECQISAEWELSDKRNFHVPCPLCGEFQDLVWSQIKWEKSEGEEPDLATVRYECIFCRERLPEAYKAKMLRQGIWKKTGGISTKTAGFHINELYSPWKKWADVVSDFYAAKVHPEKMKVWVNTSMGIAYQYTSQDQPDWKRLYERRERFDKVPARAKLLTAGVDVQRDRLEWSLIAWDKKESWVIFHEIIQGETYNLDDPCWQTLQHRLLQSFEREDGQEMSIKRMAIDTGYNTSTVYTWAMKQPRHLVMAIKGQILDVPLSHPKKASLTTRGKGSKTGPLLWGVGTNIIKSDLYGRLALQKPTDEEITRSGYPSHFVHFSELSEGYFRQLCGEACILTTDTHGKARYEWRQIYPNVETLDCFVYAIAAFTALGADRWSEDMWERVKQF